MLAHRIDLDLPRRPATPSASGRQARDQRGERRLVGLRRARNPSSSGADFKAPIMTSASVSSTGAGRETTSRKARWRRRRADHMMGPKVGSWTAPTIISSGAPSAQSAALNVGIRWKRRAPLAQRGEAWPLAGVADVRGDAARLALVGMSREDLITTKLVSASAAASRTFPDHTRRTGCRLAQQRLLSCSERRPAIRFARGDARASAPAAKLPRSARQRTPAPATPRREATVPQRQVERAKADGRCS